MTILLTACHLFSKPDPEVIYVDVPTPVSCVTWEPEVPVSAYETLIRPAQMWQEVKALLVDRESSKKLVEGQRSVIEGCKLPNP